jgi:hypothetical protein
MLGAAAMVSLRVAAASSDASSASGHLGLTDQPVALPGAGQVVLVFLFVSVLALGVAWTLRRWSPALLVGTQRKGQPVITVDARQPLDRGATLYLVNIAGERVAVLTTRSGAAMHALRSPADDTTAAHAEIRKF